MKLNRNDTYRFDWYYCYKSVGNTFKWQLKISIHVKDSKF